MTLLLSVCPNLTEPIVVQPEMVRHFVAEDVLDRCACLF